MAPKCVLSFVEKCCIWLLTACGVLSFRYNASTNRFEKSALHYMGCVVGTVFYIVFGPWIYWGSVNTVLHPSTMLNYYMIVLQFIFMYNIILISRIKSLSNGERLRQLLNGLLAIREQVLQGLPIVSCDQDLPQKLLLKLIVFDFGMMVLCAFFFRTFVEHSESFLYSLLGFCNLMQVSSMNVAINLLLFVLYNGINIYLQINARCNDLVYGSKAPMEIVQLYLMHTDTSLVVQGIVEVVSIPILLLCIWYFFIIVFSVFYTYTSLVQDVRAGSGDALLNVINPIAFFISEAGQVYFMVSGAAMFTNRARQIMPCLNLYTGRITDVPGDQAIELLTIEYLSRDYAIRIKGLFTIDNTILFAIVASTTSYMIILVQYYLQE
uniref:Gustatory receptor n=1 Tax=Anopheles epiroticus TaxID=199890 RepID=A0A182PZ15_9DIPT